MIPKAISILLNLIPMLVIPLQLIAQTPIANAIKKNRASLYYPNLVEQFYEERGNKLAWIAPDTVKTHAWDAMLLLDCVLHYGLSHDDYHSKQLQYETLHKLIAQKGTPSENAQFDVWLTDATISFMNDLHYGKLNPVYSRIEIDAGTKFKADKELSKALRSVDFGSSVEKVQPKSELYFSLQNHMRLLVGQRSGDCYEIPAALIRKMAINMERLRWINTTGKHYHLTCIVRQGEVIFYKDIYNQDKKLEKNLYKANTIPQ